MPCRSRVAAIMPRSVHLGTNRGWGKHEIARRIVLGAVVCFVTRGNRLHGSRQVPRLVFHTFFILARLSDAARLNPWKYPRRRWSVSNAARAARLDPLTAPRAAPRSVLSTPL